MLVPGDLRRTIGSWAGERGHEWLAAVPSVVASLAADWGLDVGHAFQPSGYTSLALRARRADGTACVLKVRFPDEWSAHEGAALRHYAGRAAVEVYAEDEPRAALLLERCEPGTPLLAEPDDVATRVVAETVVALWSPPAAGAPFRRLPDVAAHYADTVRATRAVDPALRDEALDLLGWLTAEVTEPVVLHGDPHPANVLRAARRPWLAIDPKPLAGDRAYDLAPVLRDRATPDVVARRFGIVLELTGLDPARLRGWALVQAVEGAAWSHDAGDGSAAAEFTRAAEALRALPA